MTYTGNTNVLFVIKQRCDVINGITFYNVQVYTDGALYTQVRPGHTLSQLFIVRRHTYMMSL